MKQIEVEDDVYEFLCRNTSYIGESGSEILRRLLKLPKQGGKKALAIGKYEKTEISDCLNDPEFQAQPNAVRKFLFILSCIYKKDPQKFEKVLQLRGRERKYFAKSQKELEEAGSSVHPKEISDSGFWVVTNNDTRKKQQILGEVVELLGYGEKAILQASISLTKES